MADEIDYKALLLSLIGSLTLCDHMGDVAGDVGEVVTRLGMEPEWDELVDWREIGDVLGRQGVTTLYGTTLCDDDDDDE